ncbi:MAG: urease accessory protein UreF [Tagaea sp.]|nr:urease accessory protein UreF [Tagaea sp.]
MRTDALLRMMAWHSPAFPVGAFAYSHGLEAAIDEGRVKTAADLAPWIADLLAHGAPRADAVFFVHAWRAARDGDRAALTEIGARAAAMRGTGELALEATQAGVSFASAVTRAWPDCAGEGHVYPVAVAAAAARADIPLDEALAAYLHAFAANLVSAAVRAIPLGQSDGLAVLASLEPAIETARDAALARELDDAGAAAPALDILSFRHETQYSRLFRS